MVKVFCSERPAAQADRATLVGHCSSHQRDRADKYTRTAMFLLAYRSKYPTFERQCALGRMPSVLQAARAPSRGLWWRELREVSRTYLSTPQKERRVSGPRRILPRFAARVVDVDRRRLAVRRRRRALRRAARRGIAKVTSPRPIVPPRPQAVDEEPVALHGVQDLVGENILVRAVALRAPPRPQLLLRACVQINQSAGVASMAWRTTRRKFDFHTAPRSTRGSRHGRASWSRGISARG